MNLRYTVIKTLEQYTEYCEILENLVSSSSAESEEIELLSLLIDDYNDRLMKNDRFEFGPVELFAELIEENNLTQLEVSKRLNVSPQLINDVLKYRREITKNLAMKLAAEFKVHFAAFLKPYELKRVR
ncbi:MAG: helix-turn-helix transcriptional regulator [Bacteroidota bacterium]